MGAGPPYVLRLPVMNDDAHTKAGSLIRAARRLADAGAYRGALGTLGRALQTAPLDPQVWTEIASVLSLEGELEEAVEAYEHVSDLAPGDGHAHFQRGLLLVRLGRAEEARAAFRQSIAVSPDFAEVVASTVRH